MNLISRFIRVLLLTIFFGLGISLADVFDRPLNVKNRPELEKALAKVMNYEVASGNFRQTRSVQKLNRDFVSTGTFRISKKTGIIWKTQKPVISELAIHNAGIVERDANGQIQTLFSKDNPIFAEISNNIQSVFSGKITELEKNFKIFYEKKSCGFRMGLIPREAMVRMLVDNVVMDVCKNVDKIIITDGEAIPTTLEFLNYKILGK